MKDIFYNTILLLLIILNIWLFLQKIKYIEILYHILVGRNVSEHIILYYGMSKNFIKYCIVSIINSIIWNGKLFSFQNNIFASNSRLNDIILYCRHDTNK